MNDIKATKCGHLFHSHCLLEWLERSNTCPQCRGATNTEDLIQIFLNNEDDPKAKIENLIASLVTELHKADDAREEAKNLRISLSDLERYVNKKYNRAEEIL